MSEVEARRLRALVVVDEVVAVYRLYGSAGFLAWVVLNRRRFVLALAALRSAGEPSPPSASCPVCYSHVAGGGGSVRFGSMLHGDCSLALDLVCGWAANAGEVLKFSDACVQARTELASIKRGRGVAVV